MSETHKKRTEGMETTTFDIISYMKTLTGYDIPEAKLRGIALRRGVAEAEAYADLEQRDKDLLMADMLYIIYTTPTQTASWHKQHGNAAQTIGSQYISDKRRIYEMMMRLYRKWDDEMADVASAGGVSWID